MPETQTPTFEIKKVKKFMGMDCPGYNLDLWMNGQLIAHVVNDGSGGCTHFHYVDREGRPDRAVEKTFEDYCKALPPEIQNDEQGKRLWPNGLPMDAELFVSMLFGRWEVEKKVRRDCAKHTCFKLPQDGDGQFRIQKNTPFGDAIKARILSRYPNAVFINEALANGTWYEVLTRAPI